MRDRIISLTLLVLAVGMPAAEPQPAAATVPPVKPIPAIIWGVSAGEAPVVERVVLSGMPGQRPRTVNLRFGLRGVAGFAGPVQIRMTAIGHDGQPVQGPDKQSWSAAFTLDVPADGRAMLTELPFQAPGMGWYRFPTELECNGQRWTTVGDLSFVPPPHIGPRPDSFFASNNAPTIAGSGGELTRAIGLKVSRRQVPGIVPLKYEDLPVPGDAPLPLEMQRIDGDLAAARAMDVSVMIVPGYSFITGVGGNRHIRTAMADVVNMYGPPRHSGEFAATWRTILQRYPDVNLAEFWNEPWIFGWTFGGTPQEYRTLQADWTRMAMALRPGFRTVTGNSVMFVEDHIEPFPESWKGLIAGTSNHPYTRSVDRTHYRGGDVRRAMDYGWLVNRRMSLDYYYVTEGGTMYSVPPQFSQEEVAWQEHVARLRQDDRAVGWKIGAIADRKSPEAEALRAQQKTLRGEIATYEPLIAAAYSRTTYHKNNRVNADKLPIYFVETALCGAFQGNAQWGIGIQEETPVSNAAFAMMTHLLEDRVPYAELWPRVSLLGGAVFCMETDLPADQRGRAPEPLRQRRGIAVPPSRLPDGRSVAVLWSYTGEQGSGGESGATLTMAKDAPRIRVYDVFGRDLRGPLPLGPSPIYAVAEAPTTPVQLAEALRAATIRGTTAVNCYAQSLNRPADLAQPWTVRLDCQHNRPISGIVTAKLPGGGSISAPFTLAPGELRDVELPWPGLPTAADNRMLVELAVSVTAEDGKPVQGLKGEIRRQMVQSAAFIRRTISVDGDLDDWQGATPVLVDSEALVQGLDLSRYHLNPLLDKPTGAEERKRVVARVYTAYDDANVYIAARISDDALKNRAGERRKGKDPATKQDVELPYRLGFPDGLEHPTITGDCLQIAFGFNERVPGHGRQPGDPWMWKGQIVDTDAVYNLYPSTEGDQLIRNWGIGTPRRNGYQTVQEPWQVKPAGAQIRIRRDEATRSSIWEAAIPRRELALFDPAKGHLRFGFILRTDEGVTLEWSEAAGVFDYWADLGSYAPSWSQHLPCQTTFGIGR